jgi:cell division septum initiation protein DivIVA
MYRLTRTSMTTIGLTAIALSALAGNRAQSADTDVKAAIHEMQDEIRELRRDVKALRELLERQEDLAAGALPDLNGVHIESYLGSNTALRAQASVNKMTGNEIIASMGGRPVFASEIFHRAFTEPLTPEGTSLLVATKALAAGQISEQDFRELQVFAIRKFAKDYIRTRALSQAMIASLGKTQKEKTEDAIAKEFNNYLERLKKDFNVTTVFDVDKRLRKQGTTLLSLKDEFRDRLLADEYLRGVAKGKEEPPAKASPMVGHPDDRPTYNR